MNRDQEREAIVSVLAGDRQAYAALVDAHKGAVFNLAYRMTGSAADAEDIAQETFIRAYNKLWRFDPERRFFTWLYTITLNLCRNHLKYSKQTLSRDTAWSENRDSEDAERREADQPEGILLEHEEHRRLQAALLELPADMREALILRFQDDRPFEDIAEICGISLSSAKMRVYRGLEKLRAVMDRNKS